MNAATYRRIHKREKGQCTWCGKPVPKGCRTWCSAACVAEFRKANDWPYVRGLVLQRDRGVCAFCGFDAFKTRRVIQSVVRDSQTWLWLLRQYEAMGFPGPWVKRDWWDADHIQKRKDKGSDELTNLRTLCVPCHKLRHTKR